MNHPRLITFTRAREKSDCWENGEHCKTRRTAWVPERSMKGEEARSFYENLLATGGEQPTSSRPSRKRKIPRPAVNAEPQEAGAPRGASATQTEASDQRRGHQLLRCSQDGDLKGVSRLVEKEGCDINFRDGYFWTAMMCAARKPSEKKHCEVCRTHYKEDSVETHERSTIHLFNKRKKLPPTYYTIPEHNVGFRMMLKEGWDRETGLGPDGAGRKFPVQTVLKRDQKGFGFQKDQKPKVTHFAANDAEAVARPETRPKRTERVATVSRKEERRKEVRERTWERNLRTYMTYSLP
ncbi:hypothetical protein FKM82_027957 [Ascaphus truei]